MSNTLVAYFSAGGTTKKAAAKVAEAAGADLYEIRPKVPYTDADLNWMDKKSRSSIEMSDKSFRPEIAGNDAHIEKYDFSGKKVVIFATSGGSGFGNTVRELKTSAPESEFVEGKVLNGYSTAKIADWVRGWLNIGRWNSDDSDISLARNGRTVTLYSSFFKLTYTGTGRSGGCPAEKDNDGCFYISEKETVFIPAKEIKENKEFCDCEFAWSFSENDAKGRSIGKTLPAFIEKAENTYEKKAFTPEHAAALPCQQVLGAYIVRFEETKKIQLMR